MNGYCVVVADGLRARFFTLEAAEVPSIESGPRLVEQDGLTNPEGGIPGREHWTEAKSGRNTAPRGGPAHGYDDHRDNHADEFLRRFARDVAAAALRSARNRRAGRLVLVAASRMLGFLREALAVPVGANIEVSELAKDLVRLRPQEIHEHLSGAGFLPQRRRYSP